MRARRGRVPGRRRLGRRGGRGGAQPQRRDRDPVQPGARRRLGVARVAPRDRRAPAAGCRSGPGRQTTSSIVAPADADGWPAENRLAIEIPHPWLGRPIRSATGAPNAAPVPGRGRLGTPLRLARRRAEARSTTRFPSRAAPTSPPRPSSYSSSTARSTPSRSRDGVLLEDLTRAESVRGVDGDGRLAAPALRRARSPGSDFRPGTRYRLTLAATLRAQDTRRLGAPLSFVFTTTRSRSGQYTTTFAPQQLVDPSLKPDKGPLTPHLDAAGPARDRVGRRARAGRAVRPRAVAGADPDPGRHAPRVANALISAHVVQGLRRSSRRRSVSRRGSITPRRRARGARPRTVVRGELEPPRVAAARPARPRGRGPRCSRPRTALSPCRSRGPSSTSPRPERPVARARARQRVRDPERIRGNRDPRARTSTARASRPRFLDAAGRLVRGRRAPELRPGALRSSVQGFRPVALQPWTNDDRRESRVFPPAGRRRRDPRVRRLPGAVPPLRAGRHGPRRSDRRIGTRRI